MEENRELFLKKKIVFENRDLEEQLMQIEEILMIL